MATGLFHYDYSFHAAAILTADGTEVSVDGLAAVGVQIEGIVGDTVTFEGTIRGVAWVAVQAANLNDGAVATFTTADGLYLVPVAGLDQFRCRLTRVGGTVTITGMGIINAPGLTLADIDIAGAETVAVSTINSAAPQFDDTDKQAVSLYGKDTASGDKEVNVSPAGNLEVDVASALPAGPNAIGKLVANSGVDIGDVDVTSLPASIDGPGAPNIVSYNSAAINLAIGADQTLVSSGGANTQIWVFGLFMMADTAAGTVALQDEDNTPLSGVMAVGDEGGWVLNPSGNFAMPWIVVATDKDLEADVLLSTVDGVIAYAIVSV